MTGTFDPQQYKSTTRAQREVVAAAWHRWGPFIEGWLAAATERMLDAAGAGAGCRVLDVAASAGGQSLAAARRVGPTGMSWPPTFRRPFWSTRRRPPSRRASPRLPPARWTPSASTSSEDLSERHERAMLIHYADMGGGGTPILSPSPGTSSPCMSGMTSPAFRPGCHQVHSRRQQSVRTSDGARRAPRRGGASGPRGPSGPTTPDRAADSDAAHHRPL
jgi:hypothetical protein